MADCIYNGISGGAIACAAATAKTVAGSKAHANSGLAVLYYEISFDGVTATAVPALVELCSATWATNSPGTNSTSVTPAQTAGPRLAAGFTMGKNWTTEPTVLTVVDEKLLRPDGGLVIWAEPLGLERDTGVLAEGFAVRVTAPAAVNVRWTQRVKRI